MVWQAYLLYPDAWWLTTLNETSGEYPEGDAFTPFVTPLGLDINVHWGDGPIACDPDDATACHGFLEVATPCSAVAVVGCLQGGD